MTNPVFGVVTSSQLKLTGVIISPPVRFQSNPMRSVNRVFSRPTPPIIVNYTLSHSPLAFTNLMLKVPVTGFGFGPTYTQSLILRLTTFQLTQVHSSGLVLRRTFQTPVSPQVLVRNAVRSVGSARSSVYVATFPIFPLNPVRNANVVYHPVVGSKSHISFPLIVGPLSFRSANIRIVGLREVRIATAGSAQAGLTTVTRPAFNTVTFFQFKIGMSPVFSVPGNLYQSNPPGSGAVFSIPGYIAPYYGGVRPLQGQLWPRGAEGATTSTPAHTLVVRPASGQLFPRLHVK